jgi:hypothetical protein
MKPFDRQTLEAAFAELGTRAWALGRTVEIAVYGGSAVMLTLKARVATRDVDAVFEADKELVRRLARDIAVAHGWDEHWLNDGVKGFISSADSDPASKSLFGTFPSEDQPGLRVFVARPEYLFAMKCRAMRVGGSDDKQDVEDIRQLAALIGLTTADAAMNLVLSFYPERMIEPKTRFGLEEIFSSLVDLMPRQP